MDRDIIDSWFRLPGNIRLKFGVFDRDFYNCDETDLVMGEICPKMVVTQLSRRDRGKAVQPLGYSKKSLH